MPTHWCLSSWTIGEQPSTAAAVPIQRQDNGIAAQVEGWACPGFMLQRAIEVTGYFPLVAESLFILLILSSRNKTGGFSPVNYSCKISQWLCLGPHYLWENLVNAWALISLPTFTSLCLGQRAGSESWKCQAPVLEMQPTLAEREEASLTHAGDTHEHLPCFMAR